jgi:hypothetical protein
MYSLTPFSQGVLLFDVTDPELQAGICVALCDYWLNDIKRSSGDPPGGRMRRLAANLPGALSYQQTYLREREQAGPEQARRTMGATLGHDYEPKTTLVRAFLSPAEIRGKLAGDLGQIGAVATWSMRFLEGGGHAIAGFRGLVSLSPKMHRASLHVFDPNAGEFTGEAGDLDANLTDLFNRFPIYSRISEIRRTTER